MIRSVAKKKYIETPEELYSLFEEYKKVVKSTPILVKDWVGKDGDTVYREKEKPLTMDGFEVFVFHKDHKLNYIHDYFDNKNGAYDEYSVICRMIEREIRNDQIIGGMVNIYNSSITQRLNGLVDKKENTIKGLELGKAFESKYED